MVSSTVLATNDNMFDFDKRSFATVVFCKKVFGFDGPSTKAKQVLKLSKNFT